MSGCTTRRDFCFGIGLGAGAAAAFALRASGASPAAEGGGKLLRPPGAGEERDFLAACVRCGFCVEACPYDTLHAAGFAEGGILGAGAPSFDARTDPCWLCRDYDRMLCIEACPTQALTETAREEVSIGTAEIDRETCLGYNGVICRACWHACPYPNEALRYDSHLRPIVEAEKCVGCGLCVHACLTDPTSIVVRPKGNGS